jgi:hypothetical protein
LKKKTTRKNSLLASISASDDVRDRLNTSEESYYSSIELKRPKSTTNVDVTSTFKYQKGLWFFCRRESGIFFLYRLKW